LYRPPGPAAGGEGVQVAFWARLTAETASVAPEILPKNDTNRHIRENINIFETKTYNRRGAASIVSLTHSPAGPRGRRT